MTKDRIIAYAKANGYAGASALGQWHGYECYEPEFESDGMSFVGLPLTIMVRGDVIRMSTADEAMEQIGAFNV